MKDSQGKTGQGIIRTINRATLLSCIFPKDIEKAVEKLHHIIEFGSEKDQIQAIKVLFEYVIGKPKQDIGLETPDDEKLSGINIRIVDGITKDIEHWFKDYDEYKQALNDNVLTKQDKVLIGISEKDRQAQKENDEAREKIARDRGETDYDKRGTETISASDI
jgi:hypothetical protein